LSLKNDAIGAELDAMEQESRAITEECLKISWFMRGGVSYEDAVAMGFRERELISKIVKSNMETTKESGLPFF
jgi:hypothetical protein